VIRITESAEGCILPVRAQPGAKRSGIVGEHGEALKIAVTAPADQGKANQALIEVLCEALRLKRSQVHLLSGVTSRDKRFIINAITGSELETRINSVLG
jgi:uncharacterized protein (TIGR00251 family)